MVRKRIVMVGTVEEALTLRSTGIGDICMDEVGGKPPPARFHDSARPYLHPEDVEIALDIGRYDFAMWVQIGNGRPVARTEPK